MIIWFPILAFLFALLYFFYLGRRDGTRHSRRQRYMERREIPRVEEPINPEFQFDTPINGNEQKGHE
jgi:hypothetical protein